MQPFSKQCSANTDLQSDVSLRGCINLQIVPFEEWVRLPTSNAAYCCSWYERARKVESISAPALPVKHTGSHSAQSSGQRQRGSRRWICEVHGRPAWISGQQRSCGRTVDQASRRTQSECARRSPGDPFHRALAMLRQSARPIAAKVGSVSHPYLILDRCELRRDQRCGVIMLDIMARSHGAASSD